MNGPTLGTVLVTGAGGFVGRHVVAALAGRDWRVRAASRVPTALEPRPNVEAVTLDDLSGPIDWEPLLAGISHVVHLAGIAHATAAIPEATYVAVNATAVRNLAQASRVTGVKRVVLISTVRAQSGPCAIGTLTEAHPAVPDDAYGRSKLQGERELAGALSHGSCDWSVLRPVLVYGPGVKANMHALQRLARMPLPLPLGALDGRRSIVGLETVDDVIEHVLRKAECSRATYLVADPGPLTVGGIVGALRRGLGRRPGVIKVPLGPVRLVANALGRGGAWQRLTGDLVVSTAALEATGWRPRETAAAGLARWMSGQMRS